jgi:hypothetical protein
MSNLSSAGEIADESADFDGHGENWQTGVLKLAQFCKCNLANIGERQVANVFI